MFHPPWSDGRGDVCAVWRERLGCDDLIGRSAALADLMQELDRRARWDLPLLLTGPSGTGKTRLAQVVHDASRPGAPFVRVDCGLPDELLARELFGNERGAFTGADHRFVGRVGQAEGGTLFLDEVGDLSPRAQATLLTFLDGGRYWCLGGDRERVADVRIVAATHRDLPQGDRFRADLLYRLGGTEPVVVPGLEQRRGDIGLLAEAFALALCHRHQRRPIGLSDAVVAVWTRAAWPGHVRQLCSAVQHAVQRAFADGARRVQPCHLGSSTDAGAASLEQQLDAVRKVAVEQALRATGGHVPRAAERLGVGRTTLYDWLQRWGWAPTRPTVRSPHDRRAAVPAHRLP